MRKFVVKISLIFVIIFVFDQVADLYFQNLLSNITTGNLGKDNYICDHCTEDILIFGSSRAEFHYNAKMIEDSLEETVYNCGLGGCGIIQSYGRLLMLTERYHPKLIILEITPEFDLIENKNDFQDVKMLKRHYDRIYIKEIIEKVNWTERIKMFSNLYRYNSDIIHNPMRLVKPIPFNKNAIGVQGFRVIHEEFDRMKVVEKKEKEEYKIDELKQFYLKKFVEKAKEFSQIVFVVSPYWQGRSLEIFNSAKQLADSLNIPFLDYSNDSKYIHNDMLFKDGIHLNYKGADEFTKDIIIEVRKLGVIE